ncbi:LOW QUALITY PROTEIN: storkhead-box protein 1 [Porphyrio hochstetteri]
MHGPQVVPPVLMNPLWQPQFSSLSEGICCTVSAMNASHMMVTQETLTEQLVKKYPGIAVPSHKILYNILGTLIKERKIYHTGEGYFIVTPNTYFITNDATEDNRRVPLEDSRCCPSPSITYMVNIECCADLVKENIPMVFCYRICQCSPDQNMPCVRRHWQLMNREPNGGGKKGCSELKPSVRAQGISTSTEIHSWDAIRSLTSVKEKLKCKRFGLGLFWRSASKKEKRKKRYSTFSAQFPPREWPVRDEDDLDNIPHHIEHEIIKRINPLTVDNLTKHTILMQKFEAQKSCISKGTSAGVSTVRQNHLPKGCVQKTESKPAKHTRKTKSKEEKQVSRSNKESDMFERPSQNEKLQENLSQPIRNQQPCDIAVESHVIYKKQITNPFLDLPWRHNIYMKGKKVLFTVKCRIQNQERASQKPQSLDSTKTCEQLAAEMQPDKVKQNKPLRANQSSLQLRKGSLNENFTYPHGCTLQIDNKCKYFPESGISEENIYGRPAEKHTGDIKKSPLSYSGENDVCEEDAKFSLNLEGKFCRCKADTVCELLDQTANEFQNVCLSNYTGYANLAKNPGVKCRQKTDRKSEPIFKYDCASHPRSLKLESEGFSENCRLLYQKAHDGDTCSWLSLGDGFEGSKQPHLPPGHAFSDKRDQSKAVQKLGTAVSLKNCMVDTYPTKYNTPVHQHDSGQHRCKGSACFAELLDGSKEHPKLDFTGESWLYSQVLPVVHRKEEETGLTECVKASAAADFCHTDEADADADAAQNFTYERDKVVACCALGSTRERRNPLGKTDLFSKNVCAGISGQKHFESTENHSITGDSGIDSLRWTEKKMKLPAKS